mmetsp:Transcript_14706/g.34089  ORF Transcript_14706/g.34089 Transcript_14706/m.34089 type:complete len:697 (-) Transcript_14706:285-2375(-)
MVDGSTSSSSSSNASLQFRFRLGLCCNSACSVVGCHCLDGNAGHFALLFGALSAGLGTKVKDLALFVALLVLLFAELLALVLLLLGEPSAVLLVVLFEAKVGIVLARVRAGVGGLLASFGRGRRGRRRSGRGSGSRGGRRRGRSGGNFGVGLVGLGHGPTGGFRARGSRRRRTSDWGSGRWRSRLDIGSLDAEFVRYDTPVVAFGRLDDLAIENGPDVPGCAFRQSVAIAVKNLEFIALGFLEAVKFGVGRGGVLGVVAIVGSIKERCGGVAILEPPLDVHPEIVCLEFNTELDLGIAAAAAGVGVSDRSGSGLGNRSESGRGSRRRGIAVAGANFDSFARADGVSGTRANDLAVQSELVVSIPGDSIAVRVSDLPVVARLGLEADLLGAGVVCNKETALHHEIVVLGELPNVVLDRVFVGGHLDGEFLAGGAGRGRIRAKGGDAAQATGGALDPVDPLAGAGVDARISGTGAAYSPGDNPDVVVKEGAVIHVLPLDDGTPRVALAGIPLANVGVSGADHVVGDIRSVVLLALGVANAWNGDIAQIVGEIAALGGSAVSHDDEVCLVGWKVVVRVELELDKGLVDVNGAVKFAEGKVVVVSLGVKEGIAYPLFAKAGLGVVSSGGSRVGPDVDLLVLPVATVGSKEDDVHGDEGATAPAHFDKVGKVAGFGLFSADDAVVVLGHPAGTGPHSNTVD